MFALPLFAGEGAHPHADAKVVLGTGRIDIAGVVKAGAAAGVEIHYLEDESRDPVGQIPKSIAYYETLKA